MGCPELKFSSLGAGELLTHGGQGTRVYNLSKAPKQRTQQLPAQGSDSGSYSGQAGQPSLTTGFNS